MKNVLYLPIALLVSGAVYGMDDLTKETVLFEENTVTTMPLIVKVEKDSNKDIPTFALKTVVSTILAAPTKVEQKKADTTSISASSANDLDKKLQKRGYLTNAKYRLYGKVPMLIHEIKNNTFNPEIIQNKQLLYEGLKELIGTPSPQNLTDMHCLIANCNKQSISIDENTVTTGIRAYSNNMRSAEEKTLSESVKKELNLANEKRGKLIANLHAVLTKSIDEMEAITKQFKATLDEDCKKHEGEILVATQLKRQTRQVNKHLPADDYDSDTETPYDRDYIIAKLELTEPIINVGKHNNRTVDNLKALKNLIDGIDKKNLKAEENTSSNS